MAGLKSRLDTATLALTLLAVGALRHYGWEAAPPELRGIASKALGGVAILCLLVLVLGLAWSRMTAAVVAWWAWEELQVVICSAAFAVRPWPLKTGQAMCSAAVGFDIGALGILVVAVLLWRATRVCRV